jgi:hypothetical protein
VAHLQELVGPQALILLKESGGKSLFTNLPAATSSQPGTAAGLSTEAR